MASIDPIKSSKHVSPCEAFVGHTLMDRDEEISMVERNESFTPLGLVQQCLNNKTKIDSLLLG